MSEIVSIASPSLSADISTLGAELQALRDEAGRDLLWDGDPAWWTGRAPILFPVVGVVAGDEIRVGGMVYPLQKHGFARKSEWQLVETTATAATFRLEDDDATRASYPFAFRLDLRFSIEGATLAMVAVLTNSGTTELPASFGFHPALRWPLPYGAAKEDHRLTFAAPEPAPIRRIDGAGLMRPAPEPTPVVGDTLTPDASLFEDDAIIFDRLASRSLRFGAPGGRGLDIAFPDMPELGIWQKPGAPYLCVEPWAGFADPQGYAGELRDKPGILRLPAGSSHHFTMRITLEPDALS
ncbi:aldose 1-epimerase family protein [Sphingomonas sp. BIUV-7]|uniref:Aldose 1-epimerase family protein n=1 Tax=Sphingomonas natans TaxID=3063330 RepID=A0ABT8YCB3_9SPHN|nr:aldose 1-epimerase family protein [Sphingomonas sp. BIUV-7]MDO6415981.1 aldose 1-epimerase family protein [Sphingomonas sp. BIUV-7]